MTAFGIRITGTSSRTIAKRASRTAAKKTASILCHGGVSLDFRAHDLRCTAASYMGEASVDGFHIAYALNHRTVTYSPVTAIQVATGTTRKWRAALETWAGGLAAIVGLRPKEATAHAEKVDGESRRVGPGTEATPL